MSTTSVPLVNGGSRGLFGRGSGGRWGSRRLRPSCALRRLHRLPRAVPSGLLSVSLCRLFVPKTMSVVGIPPLEGNTLVAR